MSSTFMTFQITGGSSGIGKELAAEAIRRGAEAVTIVARTEVDLPHAVLNLYVKSFMGHVKLFSHVLNKSIVFLILCRRSYSKPRLSWTR